MRESGLAALHGGVVLAILDLTFSIVFATTITVPVKPFAETPTTKDGLSVRTLDINRFIVTNALGDVAERHEVATIQVYRGSTLISNGQARASVYPVRQMAQHARVSVDRGLLADVQVIHASTETMDDSAIPVTVRHIPLVSLIWLGLLLLISGIVLVMLSRCLPVWWPRKVEVAT